MGFFDFLNKATTSNHEIENIFPLSVVKDDFIRNDILSTYQKILTDTIDRAVGIPKQAKNIFGTMSPIINTTKV